MNKEEDFKDQQSCWNASITSPTFNAPCDNDIVQNKILKIEKNYKLQNFDLNYGRVD